LERGPMEGILLLRGLYHTRWRCSGARLLCGGRSFRKLSGGNRITNRSCVALLQVLMVGVRAPPFSVQLCPVQTGYRGRREATAVKIVGCSAQSELFFRLLLKNTVRWAHTPAYPIFWTALVWHMSYQFALLTLQVMP
jgi:hypothetical protein